MSDLYDEGNLRFDFSSCGNAERFDEGHKNADGMKSVDFIVEAQDCLYFLEVRDYQHPNAPEEQRADDYRKLLGAVKARDKSIFVLEMGGKIKDSLLRRYAEGNLFTKQVVYLLLINLDKLGERERGL